MTKIRPMLAASKYREAGDLWLEPHIKVVEQHLKEDGYGIVQPKWDGFRSILIDGVAQSRSFTPLANEALQIFARDYANDGIDGLEGLDGEMFSGHEYHAEAFRGATSGLRSQGGSGNILIAAYDFITRPSFAYVARRDHLRSAFGLDEERPLDIIDPEGRYHVKIVLCPQKEVHSIEEIFEAEAEFVALGFEGGIYRRPSMPYKYNRSTAKGGELVKIKRGRQSYDAEVIGYEEAESNQNEAQTSALGYTKRSSHKENLVPAGRLGALRIRWVNGPYAGKEQKVGVFRGLTHGDLMALWEDRETLTGRFCEVAVDSATGGYDVGRTPVWYRWRDASEF